MRNKCIAGLGIVTGWSMIFWAMGPDFHGFVIGMTGVAFMVLGIFFTTKLHGINWD